MGTWSFPWVCMLHNEKLSVPVSCLMNEAIIFH